MRLLRVAAGVLVGLSGALMCAASWQRWAYACDWDGGDACISRQDHQYDFLAPTDPWQPVGDASQLAGSSLLVLAVAFVLLPWALTGRRPGLLPAAALIVAVLATAAVGLATLNSGLGSRVVLPLGGDLTLALWLLVPPAMLLRFAVASRGWSLAAAIGLILASPLVAGFTYAIGPYDARPWWEAISGLLTVTAGLLLLGAAAFGKRQAVVQGAMGSHLGSPGVPATPACG